MLSKDQRDKIVSIIDAANDLTIATNRADGYPQATTVSFVNDGMAIYFGTWSQSQKAKNIARDDRVSIAITDPYKTWNDIKGFSIGGRARKLNDPGELAKVTKAISTNGGDFISFGIFSGPDANSRVITFKVDGMKKEKIKEMLENIVLKFWDIRLS